VAAVIMPLDDDQLKDKEIYNKSTIFITQKQVPSMHWCCKAGKGKAHTHWSPKR